MAMSGATMAGGDNGVTRRVVSTVLDWMQEKKSQVFVVACANSLRGIPPAMMRRGRFDELFFVDLPTQDEREAIFSIHLRKRNRKPENFKIQILAQASAGFSGAEIEGVIVDAMNMAFSAGREVATEDIRVATALCKPLSVIMKRELEQLRSDSQDRMRPAGKPSAALPPANEGDGSRFENV
jgi:SpoVK/Ycf46/Vps4 family AAA+-type ATPase